MRVSNGGLKVLVLLCPPFADSTMDLNRLRRRQPRSSTLLDLADLERLRDLTFHRRPELRLRSVVAVRRFVDRTGFAFLYRARRSELPSVWGAIAARREPRLPRHIQRHAGVSLAWEAKHVLAERKQIFYGKLIRRSPTLVSLDLFPAFYALSGNAGADEDHLRWARAGRLSRLAARIMEALLEGPPLSTFDLKARTGQVGPRGRPAFDRAIAELQEKMLAVKYAEVYEPRFTFIWGPLHRWLPEPVARSRGLDAARAREVILERYLLARWASTEREIELLLGWPRPAIAAALAALRARGRIEPREARGARGLLHAVRGIEQALTRLRPWPRSIRALPPAAPLP
jgi:hypothetical protein